MALPPGGAGADVAQMLPGVQARRVAVAPVDADGVVAHRLDAQHLQRGFIHLKRGGGIGLARRRAVRAGADWRRDTCRADSR